VGTVNPVRPFSVKAVEKSSPTAEAKTTISSSFAITAGQHYQNQLKTQPLKTKENQYDHTN
jgi:hypothetical protein